MRYNLSAPTTATIKLLSYRGGDIQRYLEISRDRCQQTFWSSFLFAVLTVYWISQCTLTCQVRTALHFSIGFYFRLILNLIWNKEWGQTPHFNTTVTWLLFLTVVTKHFIVREIYRLWGLRSNIYWWRLKFVQQIIFQPEMLNHFHVGHIGATLMCTCAVQYRLLSEHCAACNNW